MTNDMQGKVCLVTGSTSGIGKGIALRLAEHGATVVLLARDRKRGEATQEELRKATGNGSIELVLADLASLASINDGLADLRRRFPKLDVLVNQAGLMLPERTVTPDGLETMFVVNYLAYFALFNGLVEQLAAAAPARVLNVTGGIEAIGDIHFDDLQLEKNFGGFRALAQSKLADLLFTYEAHRRFASRGIRINALNPNAVRTNLGQNAKGLTKLFMSFGNLFSPKPEDAAKKFIRPLVDPALADVSGQYFSANGVKLARSSKKSYDEALAKRLWEESERLLSQGAQKNAAAAG